MNDIENQTEVIGQLIGQIYAIHEAVIVESGGDEIIRFCLAVAEENMRLAAGEPITPTSIPEIAAWFRWLLSTSR